MIPNVVPDRPQTLLKILKILFFVSLRTEVTFFFKTFSQIPIIGHRDLEISNSTATYAYHCVCIFIIRFTIAFLNKKK